jgi:hypothetical protein
MADIINLLPAISCGFGSISGIIATRAMTLIFATFATDHNNMNMNWNFDPN